MNFNVFRGKVARHGVCSMLRTMNPEFRVMILSKRPRGGPMSRRGVASVLAMMFMVIFGSLAAAMAVVAQGNLRTAYTHMQVSKSMSAAETGMVFASKRLELEGSRFVIEKGNVDTMYGEDLWMGTYIAADGVVTVLPPTGYVTAATPSGVIEAVRDAHLADNHWITPEPGDMGLPAIDTTFGILRVRPIALTQNASGNPNPDGPYFRLTYELLANQPAIRVTSEGVSDNIHRTIQMDFIIEKKIPFSLISPNRIMIGKNVLVEGPLGTRYGTVAGELDTANGDPLVMRSDFYYLDPVLDGWLDIFYQEVAVFDADGDGRLRPEHPVESNGVNANPGILVDYDEDEYVDDFDLFLAFFDTNGDRSVSWGPGMEFQVDDQLSELIDSANPDRDGDGLLTASDTLLGYMDGQLNAFDLYAKIRGRLSFAVARADWEAGHGASYQTVVQGPIRSGIDFAPVLFQAPDDQLREIATAMVNDSQTWYDTKSQTGTAFGDETSGQVQAGIGGGGMYIPPAGFEAVPFGSSGAYDYYQRATYKDMTFTNVRIPIGTNALFEDCIFVGVTYIETTQDIGDENWNYTGSLDAIENPPGSGIFIFQDRFPGMESSTGGVPVFETRSLSNNLRFHSCTFLGTISGDSPSQFTHWRNKVQLTGNTRFFIDPDDSDLVGELDLRALLNSIPAADLEELAKSSILLPGWSVDVGNFQNDPDISVKLQGIIVTGVIDIRGSAELNGTLMTTFRPTAGAGPLFYGGQPDAFNTTIGYFGSADGDGEGSGPGDPGFNGFGKIILRYDEFANVPDGIPWPIRIVADPYTYVE